MLLHSLNTTARPWRVLYICLAVGGNVDAHIADELVLPTRISVNCGQYQEK
jgi:hypothetical protein